MRGRAAALSVRVSLGPRRPGGAPEPDAPGPLLAPGGATAIVGGRAVGAEVRPIRPSPAALFGPRGAAALPGGPLFVADTGHHRVLGWLRLPDRDGIPADLVLGQPDLTTEGRNGNGPGAASLNVPTGVAVAPGVLAVADAWNHRVLLWYGIPAASRPADVILGQADATGTLPNRGAGVPGPATLNWSYGVALCDGRLVVADTGNRRVLVWERLPEADGTPATRVLGQPDFARRDDSAGGPAGAVGMRWPHAADGAGGRLFVADAGTSRIMVWERFPERDGAPCDLVLGQAGVTGTDHHGGAAEPSATTLNMPYGVAALGGRLVVADTGSSRLVGYRLDALETGMPADALAAQRSMRDGGENRWGAPARDALCWPYGVTACGDLAVVADAGNHRVLLWPSA